LKLSLECSNSCYKEGKEVLTIERNIISIVSKYTAEPFSLWLAIQLKESVLPSVKMGDLFFCGNKRGGAVLND